MFAAYPASGNCSGNRRSTAQRLQKNEPGTKILAKWSRRTCRKKGAAITELPLANLWPFRLCQTRYWTSKPADDLRGYTTCVQLTRANIMSDSNSPADNGHYPAHLEPIAGLLCCPACGGGLSFNPTHMRCNSCDDEYPVHDGVPMLAREGTVESWQAKAEVDEA